MNKRFVPAALTVVFCIIGGFISFYVARSQVQFASINYIFFALAALSAGIGLMLSKDDDAQRGFSWLSILGFTALAWALVSSLASGRFASTVLGNTTSLVGLGALVCFAIVATFAYRARAEVLTIVGYGAPVLLFIVTAYALIAQPAVSADGTTLDALHLGFANSSELGLFFVLLMPFVLMRGYSLIPDDRMDRAARYLLVVFSLVATYRNQMWMASIVIIGIVLYYLLCEFVPARAVRRKLVAIVGGLGLVGAVVFFTEALAGKVGSSFLSIRGQLWKMAVAEIAQKPIFGYGADGFFGASATIAKPSTWWGGSALHLTDGTTDPHNFLVLLTVSFGLVGLALCLALIVLWAIRALSTQARLEDESAPSKVSKKGKASAEQAPLHGYFSAPFVAGASGLVMLLTMPTTVNLLPLIALCMGSALVAQTREDTVGADVGATLNLAGIILALFVVAVTGANAVARVSLGGVTYLQGPAFEKAYAVNKVFGWDPFVAHELNTAFAYSTSTGTQAASEVARMVSLASQRPTLADPTNPYYRLMYLNVLYKAGRTESPLYAGKATSSEDLRLALLKQASSDFPKQPDIDIELALSAAEANQPALARTAVATVKALGAYGEQVWPTPLKSIENYLKSTDSPAK